MPSLFLAVSLIGALFTFNAYVPQRRTGPLAIPSFFSGWLTSELALHHLAWQAVATVFFVAFGALDAWPGQVGLGITLVSWAGLVGLVRRARQAEPVLEAALLAALGPDYRTRVSVPAPQGSGHAVNPFKFARPDVRVVRDIPYVPEGGPRQRLDVYMPAEPVSGAPVLLQIHGGGWVIGNKHEQALPLMNHMASRGWVCVAANYRLSPDATFPDHLIDLKHAIRWIREEITEFGGDPDFICVTGGSAGGHLTALVGLTANDPEYQPGFETVDTSVRACVPFYGVYDWTDAWDLQANKMTGFIERMVLKQKIADAPEAFRRGSPIHRLQSDAPPFFVIHGTDDGLAAIEEARLFAKMLDGASKSPVAFAELDGAQHAFEVFHSVRTFHTVHAVDRFLTWVHATASEQPGER